MRRTSTRSMAWLVIIVLLAGRAQGDGMEQRQVAEIGRRLFFGGLGQIGSLSLNFRDDGLGNPPDFSITGDVAAKDRIDGRNHDLNGNLVGSGDQPGVALDVDAGSLTLDGKETIQGSTPIQSNSAPVDVNAYVRFLLANATITYTTNTTLHNQTIGGPADYQIVIVEDVKLTLKGSTTGYGVLVLYDSQPGNGLAELHMEDESRWYGVIVSATGDASGNSDKIKLSFGNTPHAGAAGTGAQVLGAVISFGRQVGIDFPNKAVADLLYSSQAIANVDGMIQQHAKYIWEDWRER